MEHEQHLPASELTGLYINLAEGSIEFEDRHGTVGRLVFSGETVLYEGIPLLLAPATPSHLPGAAPAAEDHHLTA